MADQRNAGRPKPRVGVGAGDLFAELRRELAENGRDVDADLFKHAAMHDRHHAAAAVRAAVIAAAPGRANEPPRGTIRERRAGGQPGFHAPRMPRRCRRAAIRTMRARGFCASRADQCSSKPPALPLGHGRPAVTCGHSVPLRDDRDVRGVFGREKIATELFFAIVSGNVVHVGDRGVRCRTLRLRGDLASGG